MQTQLSVQNDFKISGQVCGPAGNTFISLCRQMDSREVRGFGDREVIEAVISAVQPGRQLRRYLESEGDLSLPKKYSRRITKNTLLLDCTTT